MMRYLIITFAFLLLFPAVGKGQVMINEDCPTLGIAPPLAAVKDGDTAVFAAVVDENVNLKKVSFRWEVENGEIVSGQGSREIRVMVSGKPSATVNVSGFEEGCPSSATVEALYGNVKASAILFDEFGKVKDKLLEKRVIALLETIGRNPGSKDFLISYGSAKNVAEREQDIRRFASGGDLSSLVFQTAGVEKEIRTRAWIIPAGADSDGLN